MHRWSSLALIASAATALGLSAGVATASPYCYETGPGYQKCVDGSSGGFFSPIYQGPQIRDNGSLPWAPAYSAPPAYVPPPIYLPAPPASSNVGPTLGSDCIHADFNKVTTASDGSSVRCASTSSGGYRWMIDTGAPQTDPAIAGQAAWTACITNPANTVEDCRCKVDGNCG